jgi:cellulose synthase operon protein B
MMAAMFIGGSIYHPKPLSRASPNCSNILFGEESEMNIKKLMRSLFALIEIITLLGVNFSAAAAQTIEIESKVVSFQTLGEQDIILNSPLDAHNVYFRLPADWSMASESILHLNLNALTGNSGSGAAGFLEVYLNNTWLNTVNIISDGEYSVDIPIPASAWGETPSNAPQKIGFFLVDAMRCEMWLSASAAGGSIRGLSTVIRSSSYIDFKYRTVPVSTDFNLFPFPIFQKTFVPDKAILVISDQPTQGDMQAAMTISAALGRLTDGRLKLQLRTVSQLSDPLIKNSNLIFVGTPDAFPQLTDAGFPAPFDGKNFGTMSLGAEDGILQMIEAPANPSKAWLLVSGYNDTGIIKAAQAVGSGQIQPYGPENLAVITGVNATPSASAKTDTNFADLGYPFAQTYNGSFNDLAVWFEMPADQAASDGAFFEMIFSNSPVLNYDASDVKVSINNKLIGGFRFSDRTTAVSNWKVNIPAQLLRPGRNLLLLEISLTGSSPCLDQEEVWFSILPESRLHLPTSASSETSQDLDLTNFPNSSFSTFDQTALVLSRSDAFAWSVASDLAFDLGRKLGGANINIATYYDDAVPDEILRSKNLIVVGRPSTLPLIAQLSQAMPAPFDKGQNIAQEKDPQYSFAVTEDTPVGYIQLFASPWDPKLAILTVLGNKDESLKAAATALLTSSIQGKMLGNLITVLNNNIIIRNINMTASPSATPQIVLPSVQQSGDTDQGGNIQKINASLPFIVRIVVVILAVLGVVVIFIMYKKPRDSKSEDKPNGQTGSNNEPP